MKAPAFDRLLSSLDQTSALLPKGKIDLPIRKPHIIVYQPQPESFEVNQLTARAAVGVTLKDVKEPMFGAIWIDARVETDRNAGIVAAVEINVNNIRFPDVTDEQTSMQKELLEGKFPNGSWIFHWRI